MDNAFFNEPEYNKLLATSDAVNEALLQAKKNKINPFTILLFCFPVFVLLVLRFIVYHTNINISPVYLLFGLLIFLMAIIIGRKIVNDSKAKKVQSLEKEYNTAILNLQNFVFAYFCSVFNLSKVRLDAELELLARTYPNVVLRSTVTYRRVVNGMRHDEKIINYGFFKSLEHIKAVEDLLAEKFKKRVYTNDKQDLSLQNLKLKNESLAIDNAQKKFWVCNFCGNMNRSDDMSCIKCGGVRPSLEES